MRTQDICPSKYPFPVRLSFLLPKMHFSRVLLALVAGASFATAIPAVSPTQHPIRPTKTKSPVKHSPTSGPSGSLKAVDISVKQSASFWTCLAKTYQKVVIRGYQQACGSVSSPLITPSSAKPLTSVHNRVERLTRTL